MIRSHFSMVSGRLNQAPRFLYFTLLPVHPWILDDVSGFWGLTATEQKSAASWLQTSNYRDTSCLIWSAWTRASESKSNSNLFKLGRAGHAMPSRRLIFHVIPPQPGVLLLEPTRRVQWLILAGLKRQQTSHPNIRRPRQTQGGARQGIIHSLPCCFGAGRCSC